MLFLLDVNVPDAVGRVLEFHGQEVEYANREFLPGTSDEVLSEYVHQRSGVLVTWDRDFRQTLRRANHTGQERYFKMSRLSFVRCREREGEDRMRTAWPYIQFEAGHSHSLSDRRLIIEVASERVIVHR